jgi:hypothetical protein
MSLGSYFAHEKIKDKTVTNRDTTDCAAKTPQDRGSRGQRQTTDDSITLHEKTRDHHGEFLLVSSFSSLTRAPKRGCVY